MSPLEPQAGAEFPHRLEDVFKAVLVGVDNLPGMRVESQDAGRGRILVTTGMGRGRWGERISLAVEQVGPEQTRLSVSAPRGRWGLHRTQAAEKSRAAMDKIVHATAEALHTLLDV